MLRAERPDARGGSERMGRYVLGLEEIDQTQVAVAGGKGAHLGELSRIDGIRVPAGFCVTTHVFQRIRAEAGSIDDRLDRLSRLEPDEREAIRALSAELRRTLEGIAIPDDVAAAISGPLARLGEQAAYTVRSSATAEDLPAASFAGQQDTYLNVFGPAAILRYVSRCWASLFTASGPSPTACGTAWTTERSTWPWSCSRWSSRGRPASCSRPTPSPPTGRSPPWRPASASVRPWSWAW